VTHADLRARLRAYGDGTLADDEAELVRMHLASGCVECLREVFTRPVGLPRAPIAVRRPPSTALVALGAGVAVAIGLAALGVPGGRAPASVPTPPPGPGAGLDAELARLREQCDAAEERARERVGQMEARLADSERRLASASDATRSPASDPARAVAEGAAASGARPETATAEESVTAPPADAEAVPGWLSELLSSGATRSLPMTAAPFVEGASGYAVWNPARGVVVVSAAGLPSDTREPVYRLRVTLDDGRAVTIAALAASERGTLTVTAALPDGGRRVRAIEVFRDPTPTPALGVRVGVAPRTEAVRPSPWRVYP
jgi:hypothetical protein